MTNDLENSNNTPVVSDETAVNSEALENLVKAGVLYGRRKSKTHPRMKKHIFATRNGFEIIDITQTLDFAEKAAKFLKEIVQKGGTVMFVGATPAARELIRPIAESYDFPFVVERWLGGTLTNFKTIYQRLQYYIKLKSDREIGKLEKYTKKERLQFDREIERLTHLFGGLEKMTKTPDVLVVVGVSTHEIAIREAHKTNIPVIGLVSSDADPVLVQYPVPANDRAKASINWFLEEMNKAISEGKKTPIEVGKEVEKETEKKDK